MLASKFLSMDDGVRSLPIACRLGARSLLLVDLTKLIGLLVTVPFDQWLVTHVDTSWKVRLRDRTCGHDIYWSFVTRSRT